MTRIAVVDYGVGNLGSVLKAFRHVGAPAELSADPARAGARRRPGRSGRRRLRRDDGRDPRARARRAHRAKRWPTDAGSSASASGCRCCSRRAKSTAATRGLGLLAGRVRRLGTGLPVPHMGWNRLRWPRPHPLMDGIEHGRHVYFVHSYFCDAAPDVVVATTDYGREFAAIVARGQHPRRAVPSREEPGHRAAPDRELRARSRAAPCRGPPRRRRGGTHDRRPRHRRARRQGGPPEAGPAPGGDGLRRRSRRRSRGTGRRRGRRACTSWTSTPRSSASRSSTSSPASSTRSRSRSRSGGGLRVLENAMRYVEHGAERVIFGTAAVADPGVVRSGGAAVAGEGRGRPRRPQRQGRGRGMEGDHARSMPPTSRSR